MRTWRPGNASFNVQASHTLGHRSSSLFDSHSIVSIEVISNANARWMSVKDSDYTMVPRSKSERQLDGTESVPSSWAMTRRDQRDVGRGGCVPGERPEGGMPINKEQWDHTTYTPTPHF